MLKTFFLWILLVIVIGTGGWYFIIKPEDYKVSFLTSATPGTVYHQLMGWNFKNVEKTRIVDQKLFKKLKLAGELNNSPLTLNWNISNKNDSIFRVNILVNHPKNKFSNRIKLLFSRPEFQQNIKQEIEEFKEALKTQSELFKVKVIGSEKIPETTCACLNLESPVEEKAFAMMKNIDFLSNYLLQNKLEMDGRPRVHVTSWEKASNTIVFDFCFPLKGNTKNFPETQQIFIKEIPAAPAQKAIFNGNYMLSHQAWFSIVNFAENNSIDLENEVLEIFNDNPEMGGDAQQWEAEIYIPVKK